MNKNENFKNLQQFNLKLIKEAKDRRSDETLKRYARLKLLLKSLTLL